MLDKSKIWKGFLREWPQGVPQKGVVVTSFGEQVAFVGFLLAEELVLLERQTPDSLGGRKLILPYGLIDAVKIVDPVKADVFAPCGFRGSMPQQ